MADEQSRPPFNKPSPIPKKVDWHSLMRLDGDELEIHYRHLLEIQDPAKLRRLIIDLIDKDPRSLGSDREKQLISQRKVA